MVIKTCFRLGLIIFPLGLSAQSYIGQTMDNYAGLHAIAVNPANAYDSPFRTDINLVSVSGFAGSDFISLSFSDLLDSGGEFDFDSDAMRHPSNNNHFFTNVDVLGPSFMFNVGEKQSFGLTTRVRGLFNLNNIDGNLYEQISDGFDIADDFDFDSSELNSTLHAFAEVGITYGREIFRTQDQFIKGGITLKYLQGAGGGFFNSPGLSGSYSSLANNLDTEGTISYGNTPGYESGDFDSGNLAAGFGADIGAVYEYRKRIMDNKVQGTRAQQYKFKLALSITDIGSINYKNSENTIYDASGGVNAAEFEIKDADEVLEDNFPSTTTTGDQKIALPTAFQVMADYYFGSRIYLGMHTGISMHNSAKSNTNTIINTMTIAPRFESKWFSIYSPLGLRQYGDFSWGLGMRVGPLTLGSGSILTNLVSDKSKNADIYVGLKIPFYKSKFN
ncbi:MAG TPA: hypothetical protein ENH87_05880 [Pricia antarctica]|uniref:DUF5723 domain-containing protein n=1 Tax=Pricia antarctica TaxID=641691 RepID=A0A831VMA8_9FLAO|nr:hypothetical protein [Pricia antarctica]